MPTEPKRERRPDSIDDFDPLYRQDWDFDPLPDEELIPCCLWEYARESRTIKMAADVHWCHVRHIIHRAEYANEPDRKRADDEEANNIEARAAAARFDYDSFFDAFWNTDYPLIRIYDSVVKYVRDGAVPWQRLPRAARLELTRQTAEFGILRPLAHATVGELEAVWLKNSEWLREIRQKIRPADDDTEDAALWEETEAVTHLEDAPQSAGETTVAFTIDFTRFSDSQIVDQFRAWVRQNRPAIARSPQSILPGAPRKGKKLIEYRVALERLATMRLLHWRTPSELRSEVPDAWNRISTKERDFRREVRHVRIFFRRLFPFLPQGDVPESEQRKGVWLPPLLRIADDVAREMGIAGRSK